MRSPGITAFIPLSKVTINVYDFHIILYFHLGQIMQNKPNFVHFSPEKGDFTKKQTQLKPKQTQFKPNSNPISNGTPAWLYPAYGKTDHPAGLDRRTRFFE
jgi:hypothetical protein